MSAPVAYLPPKKVAPTDLDLSKNEGRPPQALLPLTIEEGSLISSYPETHRLRAELARMNGVEEGRVMVTAGGDDALFRCFLWARSQGLGLISTHPTFEMISIYASQVGAQLAEVPWWGGEFPVNDVLEQRAGPSVLFVVSPNNPTGAVIDAMTLGLLAAGFDLVVLDAAYTEFADTDLTGPALGYPNVVVVRTLSKAWGLAGLRVGYLLGPSELVAEISAYGSPYAVSAVSARIAADWLIDGGGVDDYVTVVRDERASLTTLLKSLGAEPHPSDANFVLATFDDAEWVAAASAALGVRLRRFSARPGLEDHLRISLPGSPAAFQRLSHALLSALAPEALLLDMDGVLVDVSRSQIIAIAETAAVFGVEVSTEDVLAAQARGDANDDWELTRRICLEFGVDVPIGEIARTYETLYQGTEGLPGLKQEESPLVDPVTLARWASRLPVGVVTGRPRRDAEEFLAGAGLREALSVLVTREDAPLKPDPAPIRLALSRLGVTRAWMVGDTVDDLEAARKAGVVPISVIAPGSGPQTQSEGLSNAARTLMRTTDLEELLR